jgi:hypothetical protein
MIFTISAREVKIGNSIALTFLLPYNPGRIRTRIVGSQEVTFTGLDWHNIHPTFPFSHVKVFINCL